MKINEICTYAPKSSIKAGDACENGEYAFFTSSADENKHYSDFQFDGEGIIMGTGGNATLHYYNGKYSVSTDCVVLLPNERVCCKYLYYFFLYNMSLLESGFKGAGLRHTNKGYIGNIEFGVVPSLNQQKAVITALDEVQIILLNRKAELQKLDELVKSRFVEMFGDCENTSALADLCSIITDGTHQPPKFQEKGIPFIFVSNLSANKVTYNVEKYISNKTYNELIKRTPIEKGDVLLSTVGSYGHPAVVIEDTKFLFQRHIAYLKPKRDLINSFYLHSALLAPDGQRQIEEKVKGIAQKTLNLSEIKRIQIPLPPLSLQTQFADFVTQVDKSKLTIQKSLDKLEMLKNSLMQQYFG